MDSRGQNILVDSLQVLDEREKKVLLSLYVDGKTFRETASEMNVNARTILRIRDAATAKLAAALQDEAEALLNPVLPLTDDKVPGHSPALTVPWASCSCGRQAIALNPDGLCDICGPVSEATKMATTGTR